MEIFKKYFLTATTKTLPNVLSGRIILIEDNCESLGAKFNKKLLGTFGDFGTFSFFYSHQITSGEGGMIICKEKKDSHSFAQLLPHKFSRKLSTLFLFLRRGYAVSLSKEKPKRKGNLSENALLPG